MQRAVGDARPVQGPRLGPDGVEQLSIDVSGGETVETPTLDVFHRKRHRAVGQ